MASIPTLWGKDNNKLIINHKNNLSMEINLIKGEYTAKETFEIISHMIQQKIKFHENKISTSDQVEDTKYRESRIKQLQTELYNLKRLAGNDNAKCIIDSSILIDKKLK